MFLLTEVCSIYVSHVYNGNLLKRLLLSWRGGGLLCMLGTSDTVDCSLEADLVCLLVCILKTRFAITSMVP